ncbi:Eco57I restriction-modification methylase domain-containing protein [Trichocoleus sp. FACHB-262]|uniref:Eco57I restriction-modification methylase domain-containing protein n=1 Tax=Trichocoleus sp. FACHB-262 TaxID=2692869 RepID=UPI001685D8D6|nr:TaqI-like C-terminal specificity domain-containing protein [Trichocoleus sp. FACHB-262]MBD2122465.1 Eco57I restriction-modification methylase domain-containing protein [Trichocoleus sp. FACHB-262]
MLNRKPPPPVPSDSIFPDSTKKSRLPIGVCYTPTAVVDYMVENTVGRLLAGKTPQQLSGKLRILDLACGEGIFLLRAYAYLLAWYRDRYIAAYESREAPVTELPLQQGSDGTWNLAIAERWRILREHIYGVDIDAQAVEQARRCLSEIAGLPSPLILGGIRVQSSADYLSTNELDRLPPTYSPGGHTQKGSRGGKAQSSQFDLSQNLKCGNAIIGEELGDRSPSSFPINSNQAFNWQEEFPEVMQAGGFDVVIGNPPYVGSEWMTEHLPDWRHYCTQHYQAAAGNWDLFCVFIEQAIALCKPYGLTSLIVPNKLGSASYAAQARQILTVQNQLLTIRDYSRVPIFPVAVYPIVYTACKQPPKVTSRVQYERMEVAANGAVAVVTCQWLDYQRYFWQAEKPWRLGTSLQQAELCDRLQSQFPPLSTVAEVLGAATVGEAYAMQSLIADEACPQATDLKLINSGTIDRYCDLWGQKCLRYLGHAYRYPIIPATQHSHLLPKRQRQARQPKIIVASMTQVLECVVDVAGDFVAGKSTVIILTSLNLHYLLALLNSKLISFYYRNLYGGDCLKGGYLRIGPQQLRSLPICLAHDSLFTQPNQHLVLLVQDLLSLQKQLVTAEAAEYRHNLQEGIYTLERQIDQFVYDLYGLTAEEQRLIS